MWKWLEDLLKKGGTKMQRAVLFNSGSNGNGEGPKPVEDLSDITVQIERSGGLLTLGTVTVEATTDAFDDPNAHWTTVYTGTGSKLVSLAGYSLGGLRASVSGMTGLDCHYWIGCTGK